MPFPRDVRTEALVRAARHCCVCRHPKGTALEVHHIIPEADGGPDTFDNAIPLCFDCHASAGHYNIRQPRGTKFSPQELREHRDRWYTAVTEHAIPVAGDPAVAFQYLIVSNAAVNSDLLTRDLSRLPLGHGALVVTVDEVLSFQAREVLRTLRGLNPGADDASYNVARDLDEYARNNPGGSWVHDRRGFRRTLTLRELHGMAAPQTEFIEAATDLSVPIDGLCWVTAFSEGCGGDAVFEVRTLPEFVTIWLLVTNVGRDAITLHTLSGVLESTGGQYAPRSLLRRQAVLEEPNFSMALPRADVVPNQSVVIPVAAAYSLGGPARLEREQLLVERLSAVSYQDFAATNFSPALEHAWIVGPALWPIDLDFRVAGRSASARVHPLNPGLTYSVERGVEYASCPHLFARSADGAWQYVGTVLQNATSEIRREEFDLPDNVDEIAVAELEGEVTTIVEASLGDTSIRNVRLEPNDYVRIARTGASRFRIAGHYTPFRPHRPQPTVGDRPMGAAYFTRHMSEFREVYALIRSE